MKKILCFGVVILGLLMCISETNAYTLTDGMYSRNGWNGGAFWVDNSFLTFCLEGNEYINLSAPYNVYNGTIDTFAYRGGYSGQDTPNHDPLDDRTAYLYIKYLDDVNNVYHNNSNQNLADAWAIAFQKAIWKLEGEWSGTLTGDDLVLYNEALGSGFKNNGQVMVLNLYTGSDPLANPAQSQLIRVPEPTTILLLGVGLLGLVIVPRFRKKTI